MSAVYINPNEDALDTLYHALVSQYTVTLAEEQKRRLSRCVTAIEAAGLLPNLVDACFLRPGQNTGNNTPKTLRNAVGALDGSPAWTPDGVVFDGSTQRGLWAVTNTKPFTLIAECTGVDTGQNVNGTLFGMCNSGGVTTAGQICEFDGTDNAFVYSREGGTVTTSTTTNNSGSSTTINVFNPLQQVNGMSYDDAGSPAVALYVDGISAMTDNTGMTRSTSALDRVAIGGRFLTSPSTWDAHYRGSIAVWVLFNKVLSTGEHAAVVQALRYLDGRENNIVAVGDSTTCQLSDAARASANWPTQLVRTAAFVKSSRLYNQGINGSRADALDDAFATRIAPWAPNGVSVKESWLYILAGINDLLQSIPAATVLASLKVLWALGKAAGFRVIAMTVPPTVTGVGTGLTAGQETERLSLNASIRTAIEYDSLVDVDLLFGQVDSGTSVTISQIVAATDVITTSAAHRRKVGDRIQFAASQSGITADTDYWVLTVPSSTTMTITATKTNTTLGGVVNLTPDFGPATGPAMNLPRQFYLDPIHPNNDGYKAIAQLAAIGAPVKRTQPKVIQLTDAVTIAIDCAYAGDAIITFNVKLGGNRTLGNPTNALHGQRIRIRFTQDATGNRTLTTNAAGSKWVPGPFTLLLTTTANLSDYLEAEYDAERDVWDVTAFNKGY